VRQIVELINSGIQPFQNLPLLAKLEALGGEAEKRDWARKAIHRGLAAIEPILRTTAGEFAVGDSLTLADIFLVPQLYNARRFEVLLEPFEAVLRVEANASLHPTLVASHPNSQPDAPAES
jgi:maleylpyruvate isomerase